MTEIKNGFRKKKLWSLETAQDCIIFVCANPCTTCCIGVGASRACFAGRDVGWSCSTAIQGNFRPQPRLWISGALRLLFNTYVSTPMQNKDIYEAGKTTYFHHAMVADGISCCDGVAILLSIVFFVADAVTGQEAFVSFCSRLLPSNISMTDRSMQISSSYEEYPRKWMVQYHFWKSNLDRINQWWKKKYFKNDHFANLKTWDANTKTESYRIETL
jgi:hypothetical protein